MQVRTTITLDRREEAFVLELCRGKRPCAAAVAAGYSVASARHQLRKMHVAQAVRHCHANLAAVVKRMDAEAAASQ